MDRILKKQELDDFIRHAQPPLDINVSYFGDLPARPARDGLTILNTSGLGSQPSGEDFLEEPGNFADRRGSCLAMHQL